MPSLSAGVGQLSLLAKLWSREWNVGLQNDLVGFSKISNNISISADKHTVRRGRLYRLVSYGSVFSSRLNHRHVLVNAVTKTQE